MVSFVSIVILSDDSSVKINICNDPLNNGADSHGNRHCLVCAGTRCCLASCETGANISFVRTLILFQWLENTNPLKQGAILFLDLFPFDWITVVWFYDLRGETRTTEQQSEWWKYRDLDTEGGCANILDTAADSHNHENKQKIIIGSGRMMMMSWTGDGGQFIQIIGLIVISDILIYGKYLSRPFIYDIIIKLVCNLLRYQFNIRCEMKSWNWDIGQ